MDWTEQRHHLAGRHGRALLTALIANGWVRPAKRSRALHLTDPGREALHTHLGLPWPPPIGADKHPAPENAA